MEENFYQINFNSKQLTIINDFYFFFFYKNNNIKKSKNKKFIFFITLILFLKFLNLKKKKSITYNFTILFTNNNIIFKNSIKV